MMLNLSIIIPAYNSEEWIVDCLNSIAAIPRDDFEVIVVNDGSTDKTKEIIQDFAKSFKYFKILDQNNQGASVARNLGLSNAEGNYIFFCDSDDYIDPKEFNDFLNETINLNVEIGIANGRNRFGDQIKDVMKKAKVISNLGLVDGPTFYIQANESNEFNISPCLRLYQSSFLKNNKLNFISSIIHEDEIYGPNVFTLAKKVIYFDKYFYIRRHTAESVTRNAKHKYHNLKSIKSFIIVLKELVLFLQSRNWTSSQFQVIKHAICKSHLEILRRELYYAKEGLSEFKISSSVKDEIKDLIQVVEMDLKQKSDVWRMKTKIFFYGLWKIKLK